MSNPPASDMLRGSAVAVAGRGVLILGPSGAGKSGLALRMMVLGALLVADDQVVLRCEGGRLLATAPPPTDGLIEARGVGILRTPTAESVPIMLAVDLAVAPEARLPRRRKIALLGVDLDLIPGRDVPNLDAILTLVAQGGVDLV